MLPGQRRFLPALGVAAVLIAAAALRDGPRPPDGGPLLTVVSVAGLSWDRVTPLTRGGRLPNLLALTAQGGVAGDILARDFPTRIAILASLVTGRSPQRHRIAKPGDLLDTDHGQERTPVWRYLAEAGQPCVVAGFPLVFSLEHPENRVVAPESRPGTALPPGLRSRVAGDTVLPGELGRILEECLAADLDALEKARGAVAGGGRRHLFLHLAGLGRWEEALRGALPEARRSPLAEGYYQVLDGLLGELLAWRGRDGALFLISEEGNPGGARPSLRRDFPVLERYPAFGFLWATGSGIRHGSVPMTIQPLDLTPTLLYLAGLPIPRNQDGRVAFGLLEENYYFRHPLEFR